MGLSPRTWPLFLALVIWKMSPKNYILIIGAHKYCIVMKRSFVQHEVWVPRVIVAWIAHVALSVVTNVSVRGHLRQVMHMRKAVYRSRAGATRS